MHDRYSTQLRMKQKSMHFSEFVTFAALLVLIFKRRKNGQERMYLYYYFSTCTFAEWHSDLPTTDAPKLPICQHLLLLPV